MSVVSDEEAVARRDLVVEKMGRGFGIDGAVVENGKAVFAFDREGLVGLSQRGRNESGRKAVAEDDMTTEERAEGGQRLPPEKASPGQ